MDEQTELQKLQNRLQYLEEQFKQHRHTGTDTQQITGVSLRGAPYTQVTKPASPSVSYVQSEAQAVVTALNAIIDILENSDITAK